MTALVLLDEEERSRASRSVSELPNHVVTSSPVLFLLPLPNSRSSMAVVYGGNRQLVLLYNSGPKARPRIVSSLPSGAGMVLAGTVEIVRNRLILVTMKLRVFVIAMDTLNILFTLPVAPTLDSVSAASAAATIHADSLQLVVTASLTNGSTLASTVDCSGNHPGDYRVRLFSPAESNNPGLFDSAGPVSRIAPTSLRDFALSLAELRASSMRSCCVDRFPESLSFNPPKGGFVSYNLSSMQRYERCSDSASCFLHVSAHSILVFAASSAQFTVPIGHMVDSSAPWAFLVLREKSVAEGRLAVFSRFRKESGELTVLGVNANGDEAFMDFSPFLLPATFAFVSLEGTKLRSGQLFAIAGGKHQRSGRGVIVCLEVVTLQTSRPRWTREVPEPVEAVYSVDLKGKKDGSSIYIVSVTRQQVITVAALSGRLVSTLVHDEHELYNGDQNSRFRHMFGTPRVGRPTDISFTHEGVVGIAMSGGENVALGIDVVEATLDRWPSDIISVAVLALVGVASLLIDMYYNVPGNVNEARAADASFTSLLSPAEADSDRAVRQRRRRFEKAHL